MKVSSSSRLNAGHLHTCCPAEPPPCRSAHHTAARADTDSGPAPTGRRRVTSPSDVIVMQTDRPCNRHTRAGPAGRFRRAPTDVWGDDDGAGGPCLRCCCRRIGCGRRWRRFSAICRRRVPANFGVRAVGGGRVAPHGEASSVGESAVDAVVYGRGCLAGEWPWTVGAAALLVWSVPGGRPSSRPSVSEAGVVSPHTVRVCRCRALTAVHLTQFNPYPKLKTARIWHAIFLGAQVHVQKQNKNKINMSGLRGPTKQPFSGHERRAPLT